MSMSLSDADTPQELLTRLSRGVRGWAILLDPNGLMEIVEPPDALRHLPVVQLERERVARQHYGSSSWGDDRIRAVIHSVVRGGRVYGYLAVGSERHIASAEMDGAVSLALNLLAFQIDKSNAVRRAERSFRSAIVQLMLTGLHHEAELAVRRADIALPRGRVRVAVVSHVDGIAAAPVDRIIDMVDRDLPLAVANALCGQDDAGGLVIVLSAVEGDVMALTQLALKVPGVRIALSEPVPMAELTHAAGEVARLARSIGKDSPLVTTRASAYGSGLLVRIDSPAVRAFAEELLSPIVEAGERGSVDLVGSLRVFLECDGRWSEASEQLGIHRHTLRYRLKRIEDLLGRRLEETGTRAELWVSLKLSER